MCRRRKPVLAMNGSLDDLRTPHFWRAVVGEALGTLIVVLVGCGSCVSWDKFDRDPSSTAHRPPPPIVQIALTFGLTVSTVVWSLHHVGCGHVNPAVTIGMLATRKVSVAKAILFVFSQCTGAVLGAAILKGLTPVDLQDSLGQTTVSPHISPGQAFGIELVITFVLLFAGSASYDEHRTDIDGSRALATGISITICHMFAIRYTGSSMNPARSFGPAVVIGGKAWDDHWVYWCGPVMGALLGAMLYENVFAANASLARAKQYMLRWDDKPIEYGPNSSATANEQQGKAALEEGTPISGLGLPFADDDQSDEPIQIKAGLKRDESAC